MTTTKLILGDAAEVLAGFQPNSIDLTVTSPPYDAQRIYGNKKTKFEFERIAALLFKVTKIGGAVVWVVADQTINGNETGTSFMQALYFKSIGFNLHDTMIWNKDTFAFGHPNRYRSTFEYMFVFSKGKIKPPNLLKDRVNKHGGEIIHGTSRGADSKLFRMSQHKKGLIQKIGVRFNVWDIPVVHNNRSTSGEVKHPAPFPLAIARDHILSWSNPGDTVLDPLMGSGTVALAAKQSNRNFIGIDIVPEYLEMTKRKLKAEEQQ